LAFIREGKFVVSKYLFGTVPNTYLYLDWFLKIIFPLKFFLHSCADI
jgi:hypothetical protein